METIDHSIVILREIVSLSWVVEDGRGGADDEATEDKNPEVAGFPDLWRAREFYIDIHYHIHV